MWSHPLAEEYHFREYDLRNILAGQKKKKKSTTFDGLPKQAGHE